MSYICLDCGHIFEEGEQAKIIEDRGVFRGIPCTETRLVCPLCHGDYEEATHCEICGRMFAECELHGGVCDMCIDERRKDFNTCYNVARAWEDTEIKINPLLGVLFEPSDIEQILKEYIRDKWKNVDCSSFIDEDVDAFGETLAKEVRKNENSKG